MSVPRTFVHDCRFILEEIVPESWRIQDILELVRTGFAVNTQEDKSEIKTPWLGHVSEDFESRIESENFESGHLWIQSALSCNDFLSNPDVFLPAISECVVEPKWRI